MGELLEMTLRMALAKQGILLPPSPLATASTDGNLAAVASQALAGVMPKFGPVAMAVHSVMRPIIDSKISDYVGAPVLRSHGMPDEAQQHVTKLLEGRK